MISRSSGGRVSARQHALPTDSALKVGAGTLDGVALRLVVEVRGTLRRVDAGMAKEALRDLRPRT